MERPDSGLPGPLGVTLAEGGANVAVFSAHATRIELCLFDAAGEVERERLALPSRTGEVFHGFVPGLASGQRYGLRAHGPWAPEAGHRFDPAKLLVDPYARALDRPFTLHPSHFSVDATGARNADDSAPHTPKAVLLPAPAAAARIARPVPWPGSVIYELHVRGFTRTHPAIPGAIRGTCAALAHPAAIAHLVRLGVTTVELMPVAAAIDERHLGPLGLTNYWGYNPVALLVPDPRLAPGGLAELAACVAALHEAGLEVLLDVVLNHTGEGDESGPTLSLRGLDNATYYRLRAGDASRYANDAGCGNTLALERAPVRHLAIESLRHYVRATGIDGFRFDLATTLARGEAGFDPDAPILQAIGEDPELRSLKLVAEPWDLGPGGHRLGAFPPAWGEWNDRYRDAVRRFWRGDAGAAGELATRLAGSSDVFAPRGRPPSRSVNFVCAHDGFTLADLVSHARKHNEANGEANRDGTDDNLSWNHGVEGATADGRIRLARARDARALLATLFLSRGTPLLSHGDELGRTQQGNNNAYAQDNALAWIDWPGADDSLVAFVAALARLRREHPALGADHWLTGASRDASGLPDVQWRRPGGEALQPDDWAHARAFALALHEPDPAFGPGDRLAVAFNATPDEVPFRWPEPRDGCRWRVAVDSAHASPVAEVVPDSGERTVAARSVVVLVEEAHADAPRRSTRDPVVLARLAEAAGIAPDWRDVTGRVHPVSEQTRLAVLAGLGLEARTTSQARERLHELAQRREARRLPRTLVVREGEPVRVPVALGGLDPARTQLRLEREDGSAHVQAFHADELSRESIAAADGRPVARAFAVLPPQPAGYHRVVLEDAPGSACRLVVVPARCHLPEALRGGGRRKGLATHLYALRRPGDEGIGDFTALAMAARATAKAGGALVGINPLHALFGTQRERASPYHPSDRRFLDPIYLDVARVAALAPMAGARRVLGERAADFATLAARGHVDHPGVWAAKRAVLEAAFADIEYLPAADRLAGDLAAFAAAGGAPLRAFATFEAISQFHPQSPWAHWPEALRDPGSQAVALFARSRAREVRFAMFLQWLADRQLREAADSARADGLEIGFYRDLAVGAAPDGAEAWSMQSSLAKGLSVGAPPDPFCAEGQVWNLPPPMPEAMHEEGFEPFRTLVAANARHAGALRIDHVMGLARLFCVPDGATGMEGAYVRYPFEDLLGVLALESVRARCLIVGEDLGTVPEGFRERMDAADVLSYRVLWFERDGLDFRPPAHYPAKAAACVSTHDLPTIAGWWQGADLDERESLGLLAGEGAVAARREREADRAALCRALGREASGEAPTQALHAFIADSPCALVLLQADDLAGETEALNVPGTDRERPNWRRRQHVDADGSGTERETRKARTGTLPLEGQRPLVHRLTFPAGRSSAPR